MKNESENPPDYLKRLTNKSFKDDDFGPEDVTWTGPTGTISAEVTINNHGVLPLSGIELLL